MSKPEIFTTAYTIDKASWVHVSDNVGFMEHVKNNLGRQLAERIFQECQSGEKIVTVGNPYKNEIPELYQVEIREKVRIEDLVRCKECRYFHENVFGDEIGMGKPYDCLIVGHCCCEFWGQKGDGSMTQTSPEGFCSFGERRSE